MEEIKIYHSSLKSHLSLIVSIVLVGMSVWMFFSKPQEINFKTVSSVALVLVTLASTLYAAYPILRERLTGQPYCIITNRSLIMNENSGIEIRFADVSEFYLSKLDNSRILIRYKGDEKKPQKDGIMGRLTNRFGDYLTDENEGINTSGLSYNAQELCNLLNERVENA